MNLDLEELQKLAEEDPDAAANMVRKYRKAMIVLSKDDPAWFCQYVLKTRDGGMIRQKPHHHAMHKMIRDNQRSVIWTYPECGKTLNIAVGHVLWRLGKDHNKSFGILSNAAQTAANTVSAMKCEVRGTKILKSDGSWVPIQDLTDWTKVKTLDPSTGKVIDVTARSAFNGHVSCYKLELANGHVMYVTPNHPLFTDVGTRFDWRQAQELKAGARIACIRDFDIEQCTSDEEIPPEAAEVIGYLLAGRTLEHTDAIIVRANNRNAHWGDRREAFCNKLGWSVSNYDKWSLRINPHTSHTSPVDYAKEVIRYKDGWPIDLHPAVWALSKDSIKRLLTAFWSAAFLKVNGNSHCKDGFLSGTTGLGDSRVPTHIEHTSRYTLDLIRRLMMRVGVRAKITESPYKAKRNLGGICRTKRANDKLFRLAVDPVDVSRYWPTVRIRHEPQSAHYFEKINRISKVSRRLETWAVEVQEVQHSYISGGVLSHNTYIAESPELHDVFPDLKPGERWAANSFTVERSTIRRDPSVTAIGLNGKFLGARFDGLVLDDVDSVDTVLTPEARDLTERVVRTKALSRLSEDGWAVAIGNVWHEQDLMHRLAKTNWKSLRLPVMDEEGNSNDPENFPLERIYAIRDEDQGPLEFARLYMLQSRADGEERFKMQWIEEALSKGKGRFLLGEGLPKVPAGCRTITGVDLGVKKKSNADPTAIVTILEMPCGPKRVEYELLNILTGRWNAQEIMNRVQEQQRLFDSEVWVESNGAQDFLIQLMNMSGRSYRVNAFYTGRNKYDPMFGVESIAAELATGCWYLPSWEGTLESAEPEVQRLCEEMHAYMPNQHSGDALMALWIAREGARMSRPKQNQAVEFGRIRLRR
jgi:hypothetical protein